MDLIDFCRMLRKNQTTAEAIVWKAVRNRKTDGFKFLRQHPLIVERVQGHTVCFIADFYCHSARLVVEIDGTSHDFKKDYDQNRDEVVASMGLTTLRFTNQEVFNNLASVLIRIEGHLHSFQAENKINENNASESSDQ